MELNDNLKTKFEVLRDKINVLLSEIVEFSNDVKSEFEKETIKTLEEKYGYKIGDEVIWKGVRAKIVGFERDMPKVSIIVGSDKTSAVTHRINDMNEIWVK